MRNTSRAGQRMSSANRWSLLALVAGLLTAGCLSDAQLFGRRNAARPEIMRELPLEDQARLRRGEIAVGDTTQMVWLAQGEPTRVRQRVTAGQTNMVWSYSFQMPNNGGVYPSMAWRPVPLSNGRVGWMESPVWAGGADTHEVEYLRVEFANQRVVVVERPRHE